MPSALKASTSSCCRPKSCCQVITDNCHRFRSTIEKPKIGLRQWRPGLNALLDYARPGDAIVVVGIDRLGRNAAEVMTTIRELGEREIVLRSLHEGIDSSNATGRIVVGVIASLAELELELGRERRQQRVMHAGHAGSTLDDLNLNPWMDPVV